MGSMVAIILLLSLSSRPYLTVTQVVENPTSFNNQEVEVIGIVQDYSGGDFNLTEGSNKIVIQTAGVTIPTDVVNGIQVVVKGTLKAGLILTASQILTQCS
jgi:cytochrome c-type biogenesis protein CcmE